MGIMGKGSLKKGVFLPVLLLLMSSYPPLSTDMYLPALTSITGEMGTTDSTMNLTLVLFFLFFAFATLVWGPVSDKYGRRNSVLTGISLYTLASLGCLLSRRVETLILFRIIQAFGAGAPVTISLAIVQDIYEGEQKKKILTVLSALMMLAPVIAPLMGALILKFAQWRVIFITLTSLGLISLGGCLLLPETNDHLRGDESVLAAIGGIFRVASRGSFTIRLILFSLPALFILGFVGGSSLIYMKGYGVSSSRFSLLFGGNALFSVLGASLYLPLSRHISPSRIVGLSFALLLASGGLILSLHSLGPLPFALAVIPGTLATTVQKPLSMEILLKRGGSETGAVSALINFTFVILGSLGMQIIAPAWPSRTAVFGLMTAGTALLCFLILFPILRGKGE